MHSKFSTADINSSWTADPTGKSLHVEQDLTLKMSKLYCWDFPGGPVIKSVSSNAWETGSIHGWGAKIPCALQQKKKKKNTMKQAIL